MNVLIDGDPVLSWRSAEGDVTKAVPPQHANKTRIHIRGEGVPNGRNAHRQVFFDNVLKKNMEFDNGEDHDLTR